MVNYQIKNTSFFLKYLKQLGKIIDECWIEFGGKIRLFGMGPSRISVFEFMLGDDCMEIIEDEDIKIAINLSDLEKVLKRFTKDSSIFIKTGDNKLIITGDIKNKTKTFRLSQIDMEQTDKDPLPKLSKIPYNVILKMNGVDFKDSLKDSEICSEIITMETKGNDLYLSSIGYCNSVDIKYEMDYEIYADEKASYSIKFLLNMIEPMKNSEITIMFKSDYPMVMFEKISSKSWMKWYLAPRISEDD